MRFRTISHCLTGSMLAIVLGGCAPSQDLDTDPAAASPRVLHIGQVQGDGPVSPLLGQRVHVQGVVTGNFVGGLGGFFVQDAAGEDDGDPATSDGIFVAWTTEQEPRVRRGDLVRVHGTVSELEQGEDSQTTLEAETIEVLGRGATTATTLDAPPATRDGWERYEGMWLRFDQPLVVTGNDGLLRFGELAVSFTGRQFGGTEQHPPGEAAQRLEADNQRNRLVLDDNRRRTYPESIHYLPEPLSREAPLRVGSVVHGVEGILQHAWGWRLQLTEPLSRIDQAPRPPAPELPEGLRVASFNLYNWFNGDGKGKGFPTPRGAETLDEANRQRDKIVAAILGLKPDIAALMEVENDGFGRSSSLAELVAALNQAWPEADYRLVDAGQGPGRDVMRVALIYREGQVTPQGEAMTLATGIFAARNRVPLLQVFREAATGATIQVVANHFKSKGCNEAEAEDLDQGDGQSCWNATRDQAAQELHAWLTSDPSGQGVVHGVILGDLNSYGQEDPVQALRKLGWHDALEKVGAEQPYSFNYRGISGRLDHALLSASLLPYLQAAVEWHINADESEAFDYRIEHRQPGWYAPDPYRSSDHDPLILVLDFNQN